MYAVIKTGGKQYKVAVGEALKIEKLPVAVGGDYLFKDVIMLVDGDAVQMGMPYLPNVSVSATLIEQGRDKKIKIIKFRRRKHHMKKMGHRQSFSLVKINQIIA